MKYVGECKKISWNLLIFQAFSNKFWKEEPCINKNLKINFLLFIKKNIIIYKFGFPKYVNFLKKNWSLLRSYKNCIIFLFFRWEESLKLKNSALHKTMLWGKKGKKCFLNRYKGFLKKQLAYAHHHEAYHWSVICVPQHNCILTTITCLAMTVITATNTFLGIV